MELLTTKLSLTPQISKNVSYRLIGQGNRKILFFHGFPGSSAQIALFQSSVESQNLQVLCFDRPGYNLTDPPASAQHMLQDTVEIASELTKKLGWEKFEVVVVSGGTPHGLVFTQKYFDRVTEVRVICGLGYIQHPEIKKYFKPMQIFSLKNLKYAPGFLLKKILTQTKEVKTDQRSRFFEFFYPTSPSDRDAIVEKALAKTFAATLAEAVIQNASGPKADSEVFLSDWGKELSHFKTRIHFWHGDEDLVISPDVSRVMSSLIPHSEITLIPREGHVSLPLRKTGEILATRLRNQD